MLSQGKGAYSYIGTEDGGQKRVGQLRTWQPLSPQTGPSSLEITIVDTGKSIVCSSHEGKQGFVPIASYSPLSPQTYLFLITYVHRQIYMRYTDITCDTQTDLPSITYDTQTDLPSITYMYMWYTDRFTCTFNHTDRFTLDTQTDCNTHRFTCTWKYKCIAHYIA